MLIEGFGLAGYGSFGEEIQKIGPLRKINLFIGQNNSGKSNLLLFLRRRYESLITSISSNSPNNIGFDPLEFNQGRNPGQIDFLLAYEKKGKSCQQLLESLKPILDRQRIPMRDVEAILESNTLTRGSECIWFPYSTRGTQPEMVKDVVEDIYAEKVLKDHEWSGLWGALTGQGSGGVKQHWIPETLARLSPARLGPPKVELVPAIRKVDISGYDENNYSGLGLVARLSQLQHPPYNRQDLRQRFDQITEFVRSVVGDPNTTLEVPDTKDMIVVHKDQKVLPLGSLGMGIHEVVILAVAATVIRNQVLCIEEPEIHLHPLLQKKLIRYLDEKTDNQYFFSTHSAHFMDLPGAAIFHVRLESSKSKVESAVTDREKSSICLNLGYRQSDLLQANSVIWVEGPSDRIYLSHWIGAFAPDLREGLHYAIMFYGGRLLSHLTADDPDVGEFISLRRLNRNIAILIDSDRSSETEGINATKARVRDEFDNGPGFAWVTAGREVENYVEPGLMENAVKTVHSSAVHLASKDRYARVWHYKTEGGEVREDADKVRIARQVTAAEAKLDVLDLRSQIERLVQFIRESNGE